MSISSSVFSVDRDVGTPKLGACTVFWKLLLASTNIAPSNKPGPPPNEHKVQQTRRILKTATKASLHNTLTPHESEVLLTSHGPEAEEKEQPHLEMLRQAQDHEERLSLSADTSDGLWSDPLELHTCQKIPVQKRTPFHLRNHFTTLTLANQGIQELDSELGKFENLRELDVGGNGLREVKNLPESLEVLNAFSNSINDVAQGEYVGKLQHLGVGFNEIRCPAIHVLPQMHPILISIDLSFNLIVEISPLVAALCELQHLRLLCLTGNPLCLLHSYRAIACISLPKLTMLDSIPVEDYETVALADDKTRKNTQQWRGILYADQMHLMRERKGWYDDNIDHENAAQARACQLIQRYWQGYKAVKRAKARREMMKHNIEERTVGLRVEYIEMMVPAFSSDAPPTADSAGKGGKGAAKPKPKKGKERKKSVADAEGLEIESPWKVKFASSMPTCSRSVHESEYETASYFRQPPTTALGHLQSALVPLSVRLRDWVKFNTLHFDVYDVYDPALAEDYEPPEEEGAEPPPKVTCKVGRGKMSLASFLDPRLHRVSDGRPKLTATVPILLDRRGTAVAGFCRQSGMEAGEEPTPTDVPLIEKVILKVAVHLNPVGAVHDEGGEQKE